MYYWIVGLGREDLNMGGVESTLGDALQAWNGGKGESIVRMASQTLEFLREWQSMIEGSMMDLRVDIQHSTSTRAFNVQVCGSTQPKYMSK